MAAIPVNGIGCARTTHVCTRVEAFRTRGLGIVQPRPRDAPTYEDKQGGNKGDLQHVPNITQEGSKHNTGGRQTSHTNRAHHGKGHRGKTELSWRHGSFYFPRGVGAVEDGFGDVALVLTLEIPGPATGGRHTSIVGVVQTDFKGARVTQEAD